MSAASLHEAVARALCAERGYDEDDPVGPHPDSVTQFAPYPRWEDYDRDARIAVGVVLAEAQRSIEALVRPDTGQPGAFTSYTVRENVALGEALAVLVALGEQA